MKKSAERFIFGTGILAAAMIFSFAPSLTDAQEPAKPPYLNTNLSAQERAIDLVHRMTLQEKASQLVNQARPIPHLNVPMYNFWSEALHGVVSGGTTEFPEPIGLAATFDAPGVHTMATYISVEARVRHILAERPGSNAAGGLDFWSPNLNIFRDPRWGRGQETYGEDPFLTGRMGVAFVTGMQGDDPKYYRTIATPKHFAVHSGPEPTRHFADVDVTRHDELDTYEPAFRAAITEGKAGSIMCSYNSINGEPGCASQFLLQDQLRGKWGFEGYVVSDCDAVKDIYTGHHFRPTMAEAAAISVIRGMDSDCADGLGYGPRDDKDFQPFIDAVQQGYLPESAVDTAVERLFTARIKLGLFDPPEMVPYNKIDVKEMDSTEHRAYARKLADESMVLLKNDGMLPLKGDVKKIAVVGPLADQARPLIGNYAGQPTHIVSILDGLHAEFPNAAITFVPGTPFLRNDGDPVPNICLLNADGKPGLKAEYGEYRGFRGGPGAAPGGPVIPASATAGTTAPAAPPSAPATYVTRNEPNINLTEKDLPSQLAGKTSFNVTWSGFLAPPDSGDYMIGLRAQGIARLTIDGKQVAMTGRGTTGIDSRVGRVHLEQGQKVAINVTYGSNDGHPNARLIWAKLTNAPSPEAIAAAKAADVVIAVVGITSSLEGEEMPVSEPGFLGGDRTSIDLPAPEEALVEGVVATGKPVAVVLLNGSAMAVNWINEHANAVLESWYPGEEGGAAVADTLSGKNNPAGRLPLTFYKDVSQLPNFEDYTMSNRTYRYFKGKPLYPFGYGLSYTTFSYSDLQLPKQPVDGGGPVTADVTVKNTGSKAGDEVVQLYLNFPDVKGAPTIALRGFQRIHLDAGESRVVHFELKDRDLGMVTEVGNPIIAAGEYTVSIGGGQPNTGAPTVSGHFRVALQLPLPE
jgi:beta-glucosidase